VGLDPLLRRELWGTFRSLADRGVTLLVSSHVMDEADRCDRIVLMRDGRVLADEGREELLQRTGAGDVEQAFLTIVEQEDPA
jgi:ABC-type multidrug transport system ATPase subunit